MGARPSRPQLARSAKNPKRGVGRLRACGALRAGRPRSDQMAERLFSYGTLQDKAVQLATFQRKLEGDCDALIGYRIGLISISDPDPGGETHYRNIEFTGDDDDVVEGTVFEMSTPELELADAYEAEANYGRIVVRLRSGTDAWVYLNK